MTLFSTLASAQSKAKDEESTSVSSKSLEIPTIVQLFTDHPLPLVVDTAQIHQQQFQASVNTKASNIPPTKDLNIPPSHAALHYTAVQCQTAAQIAEETHSEQQQRAGLRQSPKKAMTVAAPDLGVWNFRVVSNRNTSQQHQPSSTDALLSLITSNSSGVPSASSLLRTFCMVVDLSVVENVEPSVTHMQEALVRFLISREIQQKASPSTPNSEGIVSESVFTTSLYQLRKVQFGLGPQDEKSAEAMTKTEPNPEDRLVTISLQICVKLPKNGSDFHEYRDQQAIALLLYHLRRYAASLSASLLFVSGLPSEKKNKEGTALASEKGADSMDSSSFVLLQEQPTVPVQHLPIIWRELALGKPVWKPDTCPEIYEDLGFENMTKESPPSSDSNEEEAPVSPHSLIYGPSAQNEELIESVLLRNANYPGHWDSAKDSVWKILPKQETNENKSPNTANSTKKGIKTGDEWWLTELRDSISIPEAMKTPPPKSKGADAANSTTKTPNDAAVSNFFQDLLK